MRALGDKPIESVTARDLEDFWSAEVAGAARSRSWGRNAINAASCVLQWAQREGWRDDNPAPAFRALLRAASRTKAGRADAESGANPIESPGDVAALVEAARAEDLRSAVTVLLLLDCGLRAGEVEAVTWGQVQLGTDGDAASRSVMIDRAHVRGDYRARPKSGRARRVQLSRRLRHALLELRAAQGSPGPDQRALPGHRAGNFRNRQWRRILERAGVGSGWVPKDLRDTFASHLLTLGVSLAYVSRALGHSTWAVTAAHYARWTAGDGYVEPARLLPGEVPADLLARFRVEEAEPERAA